MIEYIEKLALLNLSCKTDMEVLDRVSEYVLSLGYVRESFADAIKKRERTYPTGIMTGTFGVAIPHTDPVHVVKNAILTVTLKSPVSFNAMGGGKEDFVEVKCLFVILLAESDKQLDALKKFMRIIQSPEDLNAIGKASSLEEVKTVLGRYF